MSADALLSQLEGVKRTGSGRWLARCPAHPDKHPSLAIRKLDDGRILVHDFAGCTVESVLSAAGLTFADLYPPRPIGHDCKPERRPFPAADVLECVAFESLLVALAARDIVNGKAISDSDRSRIMLAASRLEAARELSHAN